MNLVIGIVCLMVALIWTIFTKIGEASNKGVRKLEQISDPCERWVASVTDKALEEEIQFKWDPYCEEANQIYDELVDANLLNGDLYMTRESSTAKEMIRFVKLIREGKLPYRFARFGFVLEDYRECLPSYNKDIFKLISFVLPTIRAHGIDDPLILIPYGYSERVSRDISYAIPLADSFFQSEVSDEKDCPEGVVIWKSTYDGLKEACRKRPLGRGGMSLF